MWVARLLGKLVTPSQAVAKAEMRAKLQEKLDMLDPLDREMISLRHFEQLSNREIAEVLEMSVSGASSRYLRAVKRLKALVADDPVFGYER